MRLEVSHISVSFPGVLALRDVSLNFDGGEVHTVCGENGAGKSTLMNVLCGIQTPDSGTISVDGTPTIFRQPGDAIRNGIAIVHQHRSLCENITVSENIYMSRPDKRQSRFINFEELDQHANERLKALNISLDPRAIVSDLSASEKQLVEIAKALSSNPRFIIFDEPTASLTSHEVQNLFELIDNLRNRGTGVIYISHRMQEIFRISDRITVLKDGVSQGTFPASALDHQKLVRLMVGRDIVNVSRSSTAEREVVLKLEKLSGAGFEDISLELHKGEIVGLAGLAGAGRTELARAIFGGVPYSGAVLVNGTPQKIGNPVDAIEAGIAYVPEDRKSLGLFQDMSIAENIVSVASPGKTNAWWSRTFNESAAEDASEVLSIVCRDVRQKAGELSGGNQQKVVLAKWLRTQPSILIVDEPTHGVDVGAKSEIHRILGELAASGTAVLIISSELPELLTLSDRIIVMRNGAVSGELSRESATEEKIIAMAT